MTWIRFDTHSWISDWHFPSMCWTLDRCVVLHHVCLISFLCVCLSSCPSHSLWHENILIYCKCVCPGWTSHILQDITFYAVVCGVTIIGATTSVFIQDELYIAGDECLNNISHGSLWHESILISCKCVRPGWTFHILQEIIFYAVAGVGQVM